MHLSLVEKVVIGSLKSESESYDRRGTIATFYMKEIPNGECARIEATAIIQFISSLLSEYYEQCLQVRGRGKTGEQNHSWITAECDYAVRLRHKYWSQQQIDAFIEIVKTLAKLYHWQIEGNLG